MSLKGIRVLDLTHVIAGPTLTQILADFGAEVIKVEAPPKGEIFRDTPKMGSSFFLAINRGKKSIIIDIKKKEGRQLLLKLASKCDVFVENLSPDASKKLGLDYKTFRKTNPRIVHCRITGFGEGPYENIPAWDPVIQAASGIMSVTGFPPDKYVRAGVSMADMSTAFHATIGVLSALLSRDKTGKGSYIEVSMFDSALYYMSYWIAFHSLYGKEPKPVGTGHIFASPYGLFKVGGDYVYISISSDEHWKSFCVEMGFNDLLEDKEYHTNILRVRHKQRLEKEVSRRLGQMQLQNVLEKLRRAVVPHAQMNKVSDLLEDEHAKSRRIIRQYTYKEDSSTYRTVVNPVRVNGYRSFAKEPPPIPGEHTEPVLRELLGLAKSQVRILRKKQIIS